MFETKRWQASRGEVLQLGMEEPDGLGAWAAANVPEEMRDDPIWRLAAYRYALYLADLVQQDVPKIRANPKTAKPDGSAGRCRRIDKCQYRGGILAYVRRGPCEVLRVWGKLRARVAGLVVQGEARART